MLIVPEVHGLRQLISSEADLLAEWENLERPYPWSALQFLETINHPTQQTLVLEDAGKILGFGVLQIVEDEAYLLNFMIRPEYRKKGHGKLLIEKLFDWTRACGSKHLFLDVDPNNKGAVELYKNTGFQESGRRPRAYPRGEASLLLRKDL